MIDLIWRDLRSDLRGLGLSYTSAEAKVYDSRNPLFLACHPGVWSRYLSMNGDRQQQQAQDGNKKETVTVYRRVISQDPGCWATHKPHLDRFTKNGEVWIHSLGWLLVSGHFGAEIRRSRTQKNVIDNIHSSKFK